MESIVVVCITGVVTLVGVILFVTGMHQRLAPIAGFGLILPFNGFCDWLAGVGGAGFSVMSQWWNPASATGL